MTRFGLTILCALGAAGCAAGEPTDPTPPGLARVASLIVTSPRDTIYVGDTLTLALEARDSAGDLLSGRSVLWHSSATTVATVSALGVVSGVASGTVTISATAGDQTASVQLVAGKLVATVNVVPDAVCIRKGFNTALHLTAFDTLGQALPTGIRPITWRTSDGLILALTGQAGDSVVVLGVSPGSATVTGSILGVADNTFFIVDDTPLGQPLVCGGGG